MAEFCEAAGMGELGKGGAGLGAGLLDRRYAINCNTSRLWDEMTAEERKCLEVSHPNSDLSIGKTMAGRWAGAEVLVLPALEHRDLLPEHAPRRLLAHHRPRLLPGAGAGGQGAPRRGLSDGQEKKGEGRRLIKAKVQMTVANGKPVVGVGGVEEEKGSGAPEMKEDEAQIGWVTEAKDWAGELISGQTTTGRILVVLVFVLSIGSLVIYFYDASQSQNHLLFPFPSQLHGLLCSPNFQVETCVSWSDSPSQQIDLAFNIFFLIYFFIRVRESFHLPVPLFAKFSSGLTWFQFIAASDKVWFLLETYSFVDYFTIPPSFVAIYLERNWLGKPCFHSLRSDSLTREGE